MKGSIQMYEFSAQHVHSSVLTLGSLHWHPGRQRWKLEMGLKLKRISADN